MLSSGVFGAIKEKKGCTGDVCLPTPRKASKSDPANGAKGVVGEVRNTGSQQDER